MTDIAPSTIPIQIESVQFNQPVSEASASSIGAVCNYLLQIQTPVGSLVPSMLEEPQFLALINNPSPQTWVLADGRSVLGTAYQAITGQTNIPDLRGIFIRGLNNGGSAAGTRSDGNQNPDDPSGTFTPGQYTADKFASHSHAIYSSTGGGGSSFQFNGGTINLTPTTQPTGDNETAPKNVSINWYIRIN